MKDQSGARQQADASGGSPVNYIIGSGPSRSLWPKIIVIALILIAILSVAVWLLLSERVIVTFGKPETQTTPSATVVCDTPVVDQYNEAIFVRPSEDNPNRLGIDMDSLDKLAVEIRNKPEYEQDPTCQTILFWTAYRNESSDAAAAAHTAVQAIHAEHRFADSNLRGNMALFEWGALVQHITPTEQSAESSESETAS